jgi:hypothetical protein
MPSVSQAQNRYWHWVDSDPSAPADKKAVAKEFLAADHGRKISFWRSIGILCNGATQCIGSLDRG